MSNTIHEINEKHYHEDRIADLMSVAESEVCYLDNPSARNSFQQKILFEERIT